MGNVGEAELATDTNASMRELRRASCNSLAAALGSTGIFVTWSANLGAPSPFKLTQFPGEAVQVNGHPARWSEQATTECFSGHTITGLIQESPHTFIFMHADVGSAAATTKISDLRIIFNSVRG
jgi:hypothetical protein